MDAHAAARACGSLAARSRRRASTAATSPLQIDAIEAGRLGKVGEAGGSKRSSISLSPLAGEGRVMVPRHNARIVVYLACRRAHLGSNRRVRSCGSTPILDHSPASGEG